MAISKLKPRHASEGRSIAAALKDRLDYDKNPEKTDGGLLVTGYQCSPDTAWQEFAVSKQIYTATTGRKRAPDQDVISYLIIQSFEPGTITPEDANKLGYKLALEFTGGEHQFIVATHVDKKHTVGGKYRTENKVCESSWPTVQPPTALSYPGMPSPLTAWPGNGM